MNKMLSMDQVCERLGVCRAYLERIMWYTLQELPCRCALIETLAYIGNMVQVSTKNNSLQ